MKKLFSIILIIILCGLTFLIGAYSNRHIPNKLLGGVQAKLNFANLKSLQEIDLYLKNNCLETAGEMLQFSIDEKKMLIAEYLQLNKDKELEKYISFRDQKVFNELMLYKINWDKKIELSDCEKEKQ